VCSPVSGIVPDLLCAALPALAAVGIVVWMLVTTRPPR